MIKYTIAKDNLHLVDSYKVPTRRFDRELNQIEAIHPKSDVWKRSRRSMRREWTTHNGLYSLGLFRSHTKDVDINYPQPLWEKAAYAIGSFIFWPFVE